MTSLLGWLDDPAESAGISFRAGDDWQRHSHRSTAEAVLRVAGGLRDTGIRSGDVVSLVLPTGHDFVIAFFGALAAGATPNPIAPPAAFANSAAYVEQTSRLLWAARPSAVLTDADGLELVGQACRTAGGGFPLLTVGQVRRGSPSLARPPAAEAALLQFTSGSTGDPRAVEVSRESLETNLAGIAGWLGMRPGDTTATWLPFHHDMGLIGCLLTPVVTGTSVLALSQVQFVRSPLLWLECFGVHGAVLTATPAFGLAHVLRYVTARPQALEGWDFSRWRSAIVGAERITPGLLGRFAAALRPWGFDEAALCPAYGLAESTLAVTGVRPGDRVRVCAPPAGPRVVAGHPSPLRPGRPEPTADPGTVIESPLVGCGTPLAGAEIRILDEDGATAAEGRIGEITVRGPCVASGFRTRDGILPVADGDGRLRTGDAGFLRGGELFVVGRMGDALKVRGRTVFAEDVEERVADCLDRTRHRVAALLGADGADDTVVLLVEGRVGADGAAEVPWDTVSAVLRACVGADVRRLMFHGPPGAIARTTSGKPRRRLLWQRLTGPERPDGVVAYTPKPQATGSSTDTEDRMEVS
ncbi:AMP-binding protein [Streptomyces sp. YKOK-I1]